MNIQQLLDGIKALPNCFEDEAAAILGALALKFPKNTIASDAIIDAMLAIENDIGSQKASDALNAYLASPDHARDLFAARQERGL